VQVCVALEDGIARATVRDSGPGIAPDRLEWVFDRFASDRSRAAAGTGLGLPIARAIARAHGGELRAASPSGAEFTLEIPVAL
jgi:signal transduction histidine kinase